jgi:hypothetical protein
LTCAVSCGFLFLVLDLKFAVWINRARLVAFLGGETEQAIKVSSMTEQYEDRNNDKTLIRAQSRLERLERDRDDISETLAGLGAQLRTLSSRLQKGDTSKNGEDKALLADIRYWLKAARDTELEIEDLRRRDAGITGEYGLDLEQACIAVRCRLDSLRTCCREGALSE